MTNYKALEVGDRVSPTMFQCGTTSFQGRITASWPKEVKEGTVVNVEWYWKKTDRKRMGYEVEPDLPGFGKFFFPRHSLKIVKRIDA